MYDPSGDVGVLLVGTCDFHLPGVDGEVFAHDPQGFAAAQCVAGNDHQFAAAAAGDLGADEGTDAQRLARPVFHVVGIWHLRHHVQHTPALVEDAFGAHHHCLPLVHGAAKLGAQRRGQFDVAGVPLRQVEKLQVVLVQGQAHFRVVGGKGVGECRAGVDELTHIGALAAYHAVVGGADDGAAQILHRLFHVRLGGLEAGDGFRELRLAQREVGCRASGGV